MPAALTPRLATRYLEVALANVAREYPNHPGHLLTDPSDLRPPRELHPVFYGALDWHSSVHQHWLLVRLARRFPSLPAAAQARTWLERQLTRASVEVEAAYLAEPTRRSFERPYGWAWAAVLDAELAAWARSDEPTADAAARWRGALGPLAEVVRERSHSWLTATPFPQRSGTHASSAFGALLLLDAARSLGDAGTEVAITEAATRWYGTDRDLGVHLEPSATDFLSPALTQAVLIAELIRAGSWSVPASGPAAAGWVRRLIADPAPLTRPVAVADPSDPHGIHLAGLNLSRAWCWRRLGALLPDGDPWHVTAAEASTQHLAASLELAVGGDYVGEHWLTSFAVLALEGGAEALR